MSGWMSVKTTARYFDASDKTVRRLLGLGLPYCKLPSGTIRISRDSADQFLKQFEHSQEQMDVLVEEILSDLNR